MKKVKKNRIYVFNYLICVNLILNIGFFLKHVEVYVSKFVILCIQFYKLSRLLKAATVWLKNNKDSTVENAMKQSKRKDVNIELMPWCITFPFGDENQT